ncbi:MAG: murein biosynthesis integral membrane protein MurJ, partial [Acidobacteriota bacterium]
AAKDDKEGFRSTFSHATRLVLLFTVPASVGLIVLAEPIVRLVFERGRFQPYDTEQVAAALVFYSLGLFSYALVKIVTDGFYALQDLRAPLVVSLLTLVSNALLNWLFISVLDMDHRGLALATSCTMTLSLGGLWLLLRRRSGLKGLGGRAAAVMLAKMILASTVMGVTAAVTSRWVGSWLGHEVFLTRLVQVGASIGAAVAVLYFICRLLRVHEMDQALRAFSPAGLGWR